MIKLHRARGHKHILKTAVNYYCSYYFKCCYAFCIVSFYRITMPTNILPVVVWPEINSPAQSLASVIHPTSGSLPFVVAGLFSALPAVASSADGDFCHAPTLFPGGPMPFPVDAGDGGTYEFLWQNSHESILQERTNSSPVKKVMRLEQRNTYQWGSFLHSSSALSVVVIDSTVTDTSSSTIEACRTILFRASVASRVAMHRGHLWISIIQQLDWIHGSNHHQRCCDDVYYTERWSRRSSQSPGDHDHWLNGNAPASPFSVAATATIGWEDKQLDAQTDVAAYRRSRLAWRLTSWSRFNKSVCWHYVTAAKVHEGSRRTVPLISEQRSGNAAKQTNVIVAS